MIGVVKDNWKYIEPNHGAAFQKLTGTETGNSPSPQLFDLSNDVGEKNNLAEKYPAKVKTLQNLLQQIKAKSRNEKEFML
ncbi:hypothetical protein FSB75_00530 [Flavisolibacter ginsenosidimutans]|uniref:Uncharacterized protein n=1 Tax=Flavisolibacter ginsenosidimutans TaxID=661481 RepID=A0A5B8UR01_9BACT|nr:hypothetical protein FSB75_00530 [Flavisolibacter ginsenosidimutans]